MTCRKRKPHRNFTTNDLVADTRNNMDEIFINVQMVDKLEIEKYKHEK